MWASSCRRNAPPKRWPSCSAPLRKEILWESETATDAEVRAMEAKMIRETGANNPAIGYNLTPRWSG
jgi:hypothetical protein